MIFSPLSKQHRYWLPVLFLIFLVSFNVFGQKQKKQSPKNTKQEQADSLKEARQRNLDSLKTVRQRRLDSLKDIQKHRRDSIAAVRAYRNSKHYKDSVAQVRQQRKDSVLAVRQKATDSLKLLRQHRLDSLKTAQQKTKDSIQEIRQHNLDSLHARLDSLKQVREQRMALLKAQRQQRKDSLDAVRAYRNSKQYKDSVALVRQHRKDSMMAIQKHRRDSMKAVQKKINDSLIAVRQHYNDSLRAAIDSTRKVQQHYLDSLKTIRLAVADSLAKVRAARKEELDKKKKEQDKKKALALELKIDKEHEQYSNKKMLVKKWSLLRKVAQNTFTRYNYFYNANLKMEEARKNMLQLNQDNYDSLIALFPFNPDKDSARLASDMDTILSKAGTGIQIHDPRSKWQDDLYLLVGQAYYYKGDYENAQAAFRQVVSIDMENEAKKKKKNKKKNKNEIQTFAAKKKTGIPGILQHMPAKNVAVMWLSRTFTQTGETGKAQTLLDMLQNDPNFPKSMQGRMALEQGFIDLKLSNYKNAAIALALVSKDKETEKYQRERAGFLAGQLFQQEGKKDSANRYFQEVVDLHPAIEMDFYARRNIIFNNLNDGKNEALALAKLQQLAKDGKYQPFYDQIYYGIALAQIDQKQDSLAMLSLRKSVKHKSNNLKQLGLTYTKIGDLYYNSRKYLQSKNAYDSAAGLLKTFPNLPETQLATLRGGALGHISEPATTVAITDSLLQLASLSEKDQRSAIRKYIKRLEKIREDSIFLAQNGRAQQDNNITMPTRSTGWYFADLSKVNKGKMTFSQKWGGRKLKDNWRLSSSMGSGTDADNDNQDQDPELTGIPTEEELYKQIPHGNRAIDSTKAVLQNALYRLGKGYYTYLEDYPNAKQTFDTLQARFPQDTNKAEILYLRHLMSLKQGDHVASDNYANDLISHFPNTEWAKLAKAEQGQNKPENSSVTDTATSGSRISIDDYYNETYSLLVSKYYDKVLERYKNFLTLYPTPGNYLEKFKILNAVALVGKGDYKEGKQILTQLVAQNSQGDLVGWEKDVLDYIKRNYEDTIPDTAGQVQVQQPQVTQPQYVYNPTAAHFLIIAAPADMRIFALRSGIRDFNLMSSGNSKVNVSMTTLNPNNNLIICRSFENAPEAKEYLKDLTKNSNLFKDYPNKDYQMVIISDSNYQILIRQRKLDDYMTFYKRFYK